MCVHLLMLKLLFPFFLQPGHACHKRLLIMRTLAFALECQSSVAGIVRCGRKADQQKMREGCPQLNSLMMPGRWSSRRRSKRKSVLVGEYPLTTVCSFTGRTSSPKVSSPCGGAPSQWAMSAALGIVADTATKRTFAMAVCSTHLSFTLMLHPFQTTLMVRYVSRAWGRFAHCTWPETCLFHFSQLADHPYAAHNACLQSAPAVLIQEMHLVNQNQGNLQKQPSVERDKTDQPGMDGRKNAEGEALTTVLTSPKNLVLP